MHRMDIGRPISRDVIMLFDVYSVSCPSAPVLLDYGLLSK